MKAICAEKLMSMGALLLLLAVAPTLSGAEDLALIQAERFFDAGQFDAAITEFKRFIFFNEGLPETIRAEVRIAACYRNLGQWRDAIAWYERSSTESNGEQERIDAELAAAVVEIAAGSLSAAEFRLLSLRRFASREVLEARDALYLGIAYLLSDRTEEAFLELAAYGQSLSETQREALSREIARSRSVSRRVPHTARLLSTFIPGAGQMYDGNILDGLNALVVNVAAATLVIWAVVSGSYAEAVLAFTYLVRRYYEGNLANAEQQAIAYNARLNRQHAQAILAALQDDLCQATP
jgi:hypothetical protein